MVVLLLGVIHDNLATLGRWHNVILGRAILILLVVVIKRVWDHFHLHSWLTMIREYLMDTSGDLVFLFL